MNELKSILKENNMILEELLKYNITNERMLKKINSILSNMVSDDEKLKTLATNFGIGICSNIVGDRLLGL